MIARTSIESFHALRRDGVLGKRQAVVLSLVRLHPNCTAMELAKLAGWSDPNRLRPRIVELARAGHIMAAGNRMCAVSGRAAMTWCVVIQRAQGELFG